MDNLPIVVDDQFEFVLVVERYRVVVVPRYWIRVRALAGIIRIAGTQTVEMVADDVVDVGVFGYRYPAAEIRAVP